MARHQTNVAPPDVDNELSAVVRAGCFASEEEAVREAVQMMFAVKPQLRMEAAIRRYLDGAVTLGRAAELVGMTQWRFQEMLEQRGFRIELEARPAKDLDEAVERIRKRRPCSWPTPTIVAHATSAWPRALRSLTWSTSCGLFGNSASARSGK